MARWQPGTADRLRTAAVALFARQGYGATTVDDVAAAAGVTQRTFFRHFADKEEVLFDEDDAMQAVLHARLVAALDDGRPLDGVQALAAARAAVRGLAMTFEQDREHHRLRAAVLAQAAGLQGRQLLKESRWLAALAGDLTARGADAATARAAVALAGLGLRLAHEAWLADDAPPGAALVTLLERTERLLDGLSSG